MTSKYFLQRGAKRGRSRLLWQGGLLLCKQRGVESREKKKDASYHEEVT